MTAGRPLAEGRALEASLAPALAEGRAAGQPAEPGPAGSRRFRIGIDVGGTFVDAAVVRDGSTIAAGKALGDPANVGDGVVAALGVAAAELRLDLRALLGHTAEIVYGTTVGLNALLTRSGQPVGLITTR